MTPIGAGRRKTKEVIADAGILTSRKAYGDRVRHQCADDSGALPVVGSRRVRAERFGACGARSASRDHQHLEDSHYDLRRRRLTLAGAVNEIVIGDEVPRGAARAAVARSRLRDVTRQEWGQEVRGNDARTYCDAQG